MKIKTTLSTIFLCLALSACTLVINGNQVGLVTGSGNVVTEERAVSGVERVKLSN